MSTFKINVMQPRIPKKKKKEEENVYYIKICC